MIARAAVAVAVLLVGATAVAPAAGAQDGSEETFLFCSLPIDGQIKAGAGWSDLLPEFHLRHLGTPPTLGPQFDPVLEFLPAWAVPDLGWLTTSFENDGLVDFGARLGDLEPDEVDVLRGLLWIPAAPDVEAYGVALSALSDDALAAVSVETLANGPFGAIVGADDAEAFVALVTEREPGAVRRAGAFMATLSFRSIDPLRQVLSGIEADQAVTLGRLLATVEPVDTA